MTTTSWKTPPTGSETTTNAGELLRVPAAQLGWQLFKVKVPLPSPTLPQDDHVTADTTVPPAQPMSMVVGCTCGFNPDLHDTTVGTLAAGATGGDAVVAVEGDDTEASEGSVTTLTADVGGAGELMANPTAKPMPRATRTTAATPIRTTVLGRIVITPTFRCPDEGTGFPGTARDLGLLARRWERRNPGPFSKPALRGVGDVR